MNADARFHKPALKNSLAAIAWFNARAASQGQRLAPRKLQFMLYMAQGLFAAANEGRCLIPSRFVASSLGPADPNLYSVLENAGDIDLPKQIDRNAEACLSLIYKKFGDLPIEQIEGFVEADGIYARVRETMPDAEIPLSEMGPAYRRAFMGQTAPCRPTPKPKTPVNTTPRPTETPKQALPDGIPKVLTDGKSIKRWAPKRRVY